MCFLNPRLIWQNGYRDKEHTCQLSQQVVFQPSLNTMPLRALPFGPGGQPRPARCAARGGAGSARRPGTGLPPPGAACGRSPPADTAGCGPERPGSGSRGFGGGMGNVSSWQQNSQTKKEAPRQQNMCTGYWPVSLLFFPKLNNKKKTR